MFAIGVTDHVLAAELEAIAGSPQRWFYVDRFKDLDMRLRSIVSNFFSNCNGKSIQGPKTGMSIAPSSISTTQWLRSTSTDRL